MALLNPNVQAHEAGLAERGSGAPTTAALAAGRWGQCGRHLPRGAFATYLLVFNDPAAPVEHYGLGWTLVAYDASERWWSMSLAARGADARADRERAQGAVQTFLDERGVTVTGWSDDESLRTPMSRAVLASDRGATQPVSRGAGGHSPPRVG